MDSAIPFRKAVLGSILMGCFFLSGCLPPKTVIALPEAPRPERLPKTEPTTASPSEEERKIEQLIQKLEETEQRLKETQRKTEEALNKVEKASQTTEEAAERIQKAQEKIENIGEKSLP